MAIWFAFFFVAGLIDTFIGADPMDAPMGSGILAVAFISTLLIMTGSVLSKAILVAKYRGLYSNMAGQAIPWVVSLIFCLVFPRMVEIV